MWKLYNYISIFNVYNKEFYNTKNKIILTENLIEDFNNLFFDFKVKQL
jgi:hypothetical protein